VSTEARVGMAIAVSGHDTADVATEDRHGW
jgi:hypothetical protein